MNDQPTIDATTSDAELRDVAELMWPCIDADKGQAVEALTAAGVALRALLRGGMSPAQAIRSVGAIMLFLTGCSYDEVEGTRVTLREHGTLQ